MSYTRKLIQTRLTTDTSFFYPASNITDRINQYVSEGKAQALESVTSEDNLTNTISVLFNTKTDWAKFRDEEVSITSLAEREDYCSANSISCSIEDIET